MAQLPRRARWPRCGVAARQVVALLPRRRGCGVTAWQVVALLPRWRCCRVVARQAIMAESLAEAVQNS